MAKRKTGRPTLYTEALALEICRRMADGESLRSVCRDEAMPDKSTVLRWLGDKENGAFRDQYARAREMQADALFDEALEIANDGSNDWMEQFDKDGEASGWKLNGEHVQRSKLRVDTYKWAAGKLAPKKYGDRLDLRHGGNALPAVTYIMKLHPKDD